MAPDPGARRQAGPTLVEGCCWPRSRGAEADARAWRAWCATGIRCQRPESAGRCRGAHAARPRRRRSRARCRNDPTVPPERDGAICRRGMTGRAPPASRDRPRRPARPPDPLDRALEPARDALADLERVVRPGRAVPVAPVGVGRRAQPHRHEERRLPDVRPDPASGDPVHRDRDVLPARRREPRGGALDGGDEPDPPRLRDDGAGRRRAARRRATRTTRWASARSYGLDRRRPLHDPPLLRDDARDDRRRRRSDRRGHRGSCLQQDAAWTGWASGPRPSSVGIVTAVLLGLRSQRAFNSFVTLSTPRFPEPPPGRRSRRRSPSSGCEASVRERARQPAAARTSPASRARDASSVMIVSVTTARIPSASTAGASAASTRVEDEGVDQARRSRGRRRARVDSWPSEASIRSAGPLSALPPMIPLTATIRRAAPSGRREELRQAGNGEDRPDRDDRVRRRDDDDVGGAERGDDLGGRAGGLDPGEADLADVGRLAEPDEVVLEVEPAVVGPDLGPDGLVGHRQDRGRRRRASAGGRRRTSVRRPPRRSRSVRTMCVARSRSPSRNQPSSP